MRTFRRSRRAVDCRRKRSPKSMHHCITARQLETSPLRKRSPLSGRMCFFRKPCFIMFVFTWQNVCFFANRFYWQYLKGSQKGNHTFQDHSTKTQRQWFSFSRSQGVPQLRGAPARGAPGIPEVCEHHGVLQGRGQLRRLQIGAGSKGLNDQTLLGTGPC